jgi:hypothetical protein
MCVSGVLAVMFVLATLINKHDTLLILCSCFAL